MASGLARDEFEVQVLSPVDGPLGAEWEEAGFDMRILPVDVRVGGRDDYDAMIRRLAGLISVGRPDMVVANTLETFWAIHVAQEMGVEAVWIVRESEDPSTYFHSRLPLRIAERGEDALTVSARVVFVAEATRALFRSKLATGQAVTIPNGLDLEKMDQISGSPAVKAVRASAQVDAALPLLLCVGTPCPRKGQLELLDALAELHARGVDFRCVFLGMTEGDYLDRMRDLIKGSGLSDRIDLVPPTREPLAYFAAADLLICPSFQESLPRVVLEAMAFATPIVATRVFGVPELIRDGQEGRLVEAGDIEGMADAIEELLRDPARASDFGRRARKRVETKFTLGHCVNGYASLFRSLFDDVKDDVRDNTKEMAQVGAV
jgi:glycosyltransferase involved in cell wall biosynthesis